MPDQIVNEIKNDFVNSKYSMMMTSLNQKKYFQLLGQYNSIDTQSNSDKWMMVICYAAMMPTQSLIIFTILDLRLHCTQSCIHRPQDNVYTKHE